jgi:hypothetical protein
MKRLRPLHKIYGGLRIIKAAGIGGTGFKSTSAEYAMDPVVVIGCVVASTSIHVILSRIST